MRINSYLLYLDDRNDIRKSYDIHLPSSFLSAILRLSRSTNIATARGKMYARVTLDYAVKHSLLFIRDIVLFACNHPVSFIFVSIAKFAKCFGSTSLSINFKNILSEGNINIYLAFKLRAVEKRAKEFLQDEASKCR